MFSDNLHVCSRFTKHRKERFLRRQSRGSMRSNSRVPLLHRQRHTRDVRWKLGGYWLWQSGVFKRVFFWPEWRWILQWRLNEVYRSNFSGIKLYYILKERALILLALTFLCALRHFIRCSPVLFRDMIRPASLQCSLWTLFPGTLFHLRVGGFVCY